MVRAEAEAIQNRLTAKRGYYTCDSRCFCTNGRRNQEVSIPKTKACVANFLKNQKNSMDLWCTCFFNCLIIGLILKMATALSAKTMRNSLFNYVFDVWTCSLATSKTVFSVTYFHTSQDKYVPVHVLYKHPPLQIGRYTHSRHCFIWNGEYFWYSLYSIPSSSIFPIENFCSPIWEMHL